MVATYNSLPGNEHPPQSHIKSEIPCLSAVVLSMIQTMLLMEQGPSAEHQALD